MSDDPNNQSAVLEPDTSEAEAAAKKAAEEAAAKKAADEAAAKKATDEAAAKKAAEEAAEAEAIKKSADEAAAKKAAEEAAAKKAAEEAAEAEAIKKSADEAAVKNVALKVQKEESNTKQKYCMGTSELLFKVLKAIDFKGGESSVSSLTVALMLDEKVFIDGLNAGVILGLIERDGSTYINTELAERWLSVSSIDQKAIIAKQFLGIEFYRDIIFRMKISANKEMQMKEIDKAIYIALSNIREDIRKQISASLVDYARYANVIELTNNTGNPGVRLTVNGEAQLSKILEERKKKKRAGKLGTSGSPSSSSTAISSNLACQSCGKPVLPDYMLCPYCGVSLKRSCGNCGKDLQPGWKMCPFCGSS